MLHGYFLPTAYFLPAAHLENFFMANKHLRETPVFVYNLEDLIHVLDVSCHHAEMLLLFRHGRRPDFDSAEARSELMMVVSRDRCQNCANVFKALEKLVSINVTAVTNLQALEPI
eukprot:COSAG01_NODE_42500_length_439_cov_1.191176_1_plen_114_part_10